MLNGTVVCGTTASLHSFSVIIAHHLGRSTMKLLQAAQNLTKATICSIIWKFLKKGLHQLKQMGSRLKKGEVKLKRCARLDPPSMKRVLRSVMDHAQQKHSNSS